MAETGSFPDSHRIQEGGVSVSRRKKIALIVLGSLGGLLLLVGIAGFVTVQTQWFRDTIRTKIVAAVEDSSGGRTEIGSFDFDWHHLRAVVRNFVVHGSEPANVPPLLEAKLIQVDLKLTSPFKNFVDIAYLLVDTPRANVIMQPDGSSNIPSPRIKHPSSKSGLETVVDLAIGRFDLRGGSFILSQRAMPLDAHGQNLRAQLSYNMLSPSYKGEISLQPLLVSAGANRPVDITVTLPLLLEKDKLQIDNARITTPESQIVVSGTMDHLAAPRVAARLNARIALPEAKRIAGASMPFQTGTVNADAAVDMDDLGIRISSARVTLGQSELEASGTLKELVEFRARLATDELERMLRMAPQHLGIVQVSGKARINPPQSIDLPQLAVAALGGSFAGSASLAYMEQYKVQGKLAHFDLHTVARPFLAKPLPYDGVISGAVQAEGNTKKPVAVVARADLAIAPGRQGIPVSGRINADYDGRADTVTLARSYLALPATRLDLSGSLGQQIQVRLVSHSLKDFQPVVELPVALQSGGAATFTGAVTGKLSAPRVSGHLEVMNFAAQGRPFHLLAADLSGSQAGAAVNSGTLQQGALQATFSGSVGLKNWKPEDRQPVTANVDIRDAGVQDILALAEQKDTPVTGRLTAAARIAGTVGDPRGNVAVDVVNGTAYEDRFDRLTVRANLTQQLVDVPTLQLTAGAARIDATAAFQHPRDALDRGTLRVHVASNQFNLDQFKNVNEQAPGLGGMAQILADATASLAPVAGKTDVNLTSLNANLTARGLYMDKQKLGDVTATAQTVGTNVNFQVNSDFAGSTIRVNGRALLNSDHATTATASISGLPIEQVLRVAHKSDVPASGILSANADVSGTFADPRAKATFTVTKGMADQQPFDRLQATVNYTNQLVDVPSLELAVGANRLDFSGSFQHPANRYDDGQVRFKLNSTRIQVAQLREIQQMKPGLAGALQLTADGAATLRHGTTPLVSTLNANIAATGMTLNGKPAGDVALTADTHGQELQFRLKSDFAQANIQGSGTMQLRGDYPLDAKVAFAHVTYAGLGPWLNVSGRPGFDALAEGKLDVKGPAEDPEKLQGTLQVSRLEVSSAPPPGGKKARRTASLQNAGPITIAVDKAVARIQNFRLTGPDMNLALSGTAALQGKQALDLHANGNINLEVAQAFDPTIFAAGSVQLNAAVQGTMAQPAINGQLQLQKASFNTMDAPNGLSNANGVIVFNGDRALIQNLTGESGGGQITLGGSVVYSGPSVQLHVQATAHHVHVNYPEGMSIELNATLGVAGTPNRNVLSGDATILGLAMYSHSDIGSMLSQAATPPPVSQPQTGLLGGMQFDVRIRTSPNIQFRTSLTQNIQATADLRLRGTPDQPGMLGRLDVSSGEVIFFGSKYNIDVGTLGFYDPHKINPYLNVSLETTAKGITVVLNVTGPMDKLKLAYSSDPPMQFSDIVSLLATGKNNTTDPVLAAREPPAQPQTIQQKGASALLSQGVASPIAGRLQRLFGVSKLQIDPQILGASNTPQARLTLEQQISKNLLFSYTQDVASSNPQIIRVQWDIDPTWTAVAQRDERGEVALDFFYKKRFH
jgi:translocation and assembly module TamB